MEDKKEKWYELEKQLEMKFEAAKKTLAIEFAKEHNTITIGDVIEDNVGKIKVEKITYQYTINGFPTCAYHGVELKKDGTPKKNSYRQVWQSNLR
jgi:hypothetical protein